MRKIKVAVVGCGVIGPLHVECYKMHKNVEIAWLCDLDVAKARKLADGAGAATQITDNAADIFNDPRVDAVSICTDHASHAPLVEAALKAGKSVLCEKALAQNPAALKKMMVAVAKYPDVVMSGVFQHRFDPINREVKKILEEGLFGTLLTAGVQVRCYRSDEYYKADPWRGTIKYEGGSVLINQAIHYIDQLLWIAGGFESVVGATANITHKGVIETEDTAAAVLRLKNGAIGIIEATCSSNIDWETTIALHGSAGALEIRNDKVAKIDFKDKKVEARVARRLEKVIAPKAAKSGKTYYGSGHPAQIADFVEAVAKGRAPFVSAESAAETAAAVFAIYKAAAIAASRLRAEG
ncbi:MAG: Gfo/Idh/MocA family oxidoreductase [Kiritimatiellaeota bacterium]|nr:Gfo/Idh/MocA family oxidoreductase [Kiritimatiellota bacterium]